MQVRGKVCGVIEERRIDSGCEGERDVKVKDVEG